MNTKQQSLNQEQYSGKYINLLTKDQIQKCLDNIDDQDYIRDFQESINNLEYVKIKWLGQEIPEFWDNNAHVNTYRVAVKNKEGRKFYMKWHNSIYATESGIMPDLYDILTTVASEGLMESGSFQDFCNELAYDEDSRKAYKIYKAVLKLQDNISKVFTKNELYSFPS